MSRKMKRDAYTYDVPAAIYSTLPKVTLRVVREAKKGVFPIHEVRIGRALLFFGGSDISAITYIYPKEPGNDKSPLLYEQFAKDSMRGREVAKYIIDHEVVFEGGEFTFMTSGKRYHAELHRILATECTDIINYQVEEVLGANKE